MRLKFGVRRSLLAAVAVVALSALASVSAASASAASPEFLGGTGSFTIKGSNMALYAPGRASWSCGKVTGSGAITGKKTGNVTLSLTCANTYGMCHTKGNLNEIKTKELEMIPVIPVKAEGVGIELRPKVGTTFVEGETPFGGSCEIKGSLIVLATPIGSPRASKEWTWNFNGQPEGVQAPSQYENESHEIVNSWLEYNTTRFGSFQKVSWSGKQTMNTPWYLEIH